MSSQWSRLVTKPAGAIPGGLFGQIVVALTTLLIAAFIIAYAIQGGSSEEEPEATSIGPALSGEGMQRRVENTIEQQKRLEQTRRAAQARDRLRAQMQQPASGRPSVRTAGLTKGRSSVAGGHGASGTYPPDPMTEAELAEQELLRELRLQAIRRRHESLRSKPVAQSVRPQPGRALPTMRNGNPPSRSVRRPSDPDIEGLLQATKNLMRLENEDVAPAASSGQPMLPLAAAGPSAPAPGGPVAAQNQPPAHSPENPGRVTTPADPEGFERIYEGSFLEGALITQLSGDFPGPALAQVSVPFYSGDRQRVLIPRGTRAIGTAQTVTDRDQTRLAVGFHRLVFPDGRWVSLKFEGLDQVGTTALKDKVNRHYLQLFAAAGAVGILSGLTLQGSNPYAGGLQGFRAGAGQGLGQGATQIMQRVLNSMPTGTIRAGPRLRIWFTADVLIPVETAPQAARLHP
ncbi:MAG: TrbI/VirB10 family protein [Acidobacteriota bacterium]|nr:TrbI/VirB10 family protein [Acidobacteriota bacterium]